MSLPRRIEQMSLLDVVIVRPNVHAQKRGKGSNCLIALRREGVVYVRNAVRDAGGVVVLNMASAYYPVVRNDGRTPHRRSGVGIEKLDAAGFRVHRRPFIVSQELPNFACDTAEDDFNRWWRRSFYPGCDSHGFLQARRRLTPREALIRQFYEKTGVRWTPTRIRKLARSYDCDIESLCAAVRLPLWIFAWYEELYQDDPTNLPAPARMFLGPAFLVFDILNGLKQGTTDTTLFPLNALRISAPSAKPADTAGVAA